MSKEITVLKMFGAALASKTLLAFKDVNELAMKVGYVVTPTACTDATVQFLKEQKIDVNSTFYKNWSDITSKSRFEIWQDQILNYIGVYGGGNYHYVPNDGSDAPDFTNFKVIDTITQAEVDAKCQSMLYSGIALSQETINDILLVIAEFDIDLIKNKEAMCILSKLTGKLSTNNDEFIRYLVYLATSKTLLIKDRLTIECIKNAKIDVSKQITAFGVAKLAASFNRYKNLLLAFKSNKQNVGVINQLSRLSKTNHVPFVGGYFENILADAKLLPQLAERLVNCSNFKKITLLQTINIRKKECDMSFYGVRNGKLWASDKTHKHNLTYYSVVYDMVYDSLIKSLSEKRTIDGIETTICLDKNAKLTLPTSEKSFMGNYPLGTAFNIGDEDAIVGIHWRGADGAQDLDLSLLPIDGGKLGWNSDFVSKNSDAVFSGDMTRANPEATELFYSKGGLIKGLFKVNLFNGAPKSKFKIFLAKEKIDGTVRGFMVNPNNILFTIDAVMDAEEQMFGVIGNGKFILAQFKTGNKIVSGDSITNKYTEFALNTLDCYLDLEKVFTDAGYTFVEKNEKVTDEKVIVDLNNLDKATLISLVA
jgi:hypothetical protein